MNNPFLVLFPLAKRDSGAVKFMSEGEAETKRLKAVEFLRRIGNDDSADDFEDMSASEYAQHKGAELLNENPQRRNKPMAKSNKDLQRELDEANNYIEELESKLDDIAGLAGDEDDDDEEDAEIADEDDDEDPE